MPSAASAPTGPTPPAGARARRCSDETAEGEYGDVVVTVGVGHDLGELGEDVVEVGVVVDVGEQLLGGDLEALEPDVDALTAALDEPVRVRQQEVTGDEGHPRGQPRELAEAVDRGAVLGDEASATA